MIRLEVALPEGRSYPVLVGPQAAEELASVLPSGVQRVAVVTQSDIPVAVDPGVDHRIFPIPNGETAKTLSTCLLYTSPSPRDKRQSRMPSSA